jgi:hypothetical protein
MPKNKPKRNPKQQTQGSLSDSSDDDLAFCGDTALPEQSEDEFALVIEESEARRKNKQKKGLRRARSGHVRKSKAAANKRSDQDDHLLQVAPKLLKNLQMEARQSRLSDADHDRLRRGGQWEVKTSMYSERYLRDTVSNLVDYLLGRYDCSLGAP